MALTLATSIGAFAAGVHTGTKYSGRTGQHHVLSFKVSGKGTAKPRALLLYPVNGTRQAAGSSLYMAASAVDADGTPLRGRALTWYSGRRLLGHGAALATAHLRPGRHVIRVVARGVHGRRGVARTHVTITR